MEVASGPGVKKGKLDARALPGWMSREDALNFLLNDCLFDDPISTDRAEEIWRQHKGKVNDLSSECSAAEILPMSESDLKVVRRFRSSHPNEHSIVDIVRLNPMDLIVHQLWVSPTLSERYAATATPAKWNQAALLDPPPAVPSKMRQEENAFVFDLPHPEFMLASRQGTQPLLQITAPQAFVTVAFHGARAVLLSGYHRAFALAQHLATMPNAPRGVLFAVSNALELLGPDADDVKALMEGPRPPRLRDFLNADLYVPLQIRKRQFQMRVSFEISDREISDWEETAANPVEVASGVSAEHGSALKSGNRNQPNELRALFDRAVSMYQEKRLDEAIRIYQTILKIHPDYEHVHSNLSTVYLDAGRIAEAKSHAQRAIRLEPGSVSAQVNLGAAFTAEGRHEDARRHYRQALAIDPGNYAALTNLGRAAAVSGDFEDAISKFRRAIADQPDCAEAWFQLAELRKFSPDDPDLAAMERLASSGRITGKDRAMLHFALAKAFEDCRFFEQAFKHLRIGNETQRGLLTYEEDKSTALFRAVREFCTKEAIERLQGPGHKTGSPVFVVGMPRSGTTLIEQVLSSHPLVHGAGELGTLTNLFWRTFDRQSVAHPRLQLQDLDRRRLSELAQTYLDTLPRAPAKTRIVDKMPGNFIFAGLIHIMFPNAKIVHAVRAPMDTCFSCYATYFASGQQFTYDLAELGRYYQRYRDLMTHWRSVLPEGCILDLHYEDLVGDFENQVRRLLDFCGLEWDERCRTFYETRRPVSTASLAQVRRGLYDTSVGRWRKFASNLGPLIRELEGTCESGTTPEYAVYGAIGA